MTFHITTACKNALYICACVCCLQCIYNEHTGDYMTGEVNEEAASWWSAGGSLAARCKLSVDFPPSDIGSDAFLTFHIDLRGTQQR